MSMLEVQGSPEETQAKYKKIIDYGNKLGYQTFLDVSAQLFKKLEIDYSDLKFFADPQKKPAPSDRWFYSHVKKSAAR